MSFAGLRVLSLESRRSLEMAELIRKQGGEPVVAPSMREVSLGEDSEALRFAESLFSGEFDMLVLLTGVGTRQLSLAISAYYPEEAFIEALKGITIAARGPKPLAVLREMGLTPAVVAPPPNTWRELVPVIAARPERYLAVQEYGRSNAEMLAALRANGAEVTPVRIYRYGLPEDCGPLRKAARRLAAGEIDVALFTTAVQIENLARVGKEEGIEEQMLERLRQCQIVSIGPTTTEALEEFGLHPAFEPSHPKMGILVKEAAERARAPQGT